MELLEAVKHVILKNKKPMHFKEIARIISAEKLVEKKGTQTLETVINARVALDVKKAEKYNQNTDFVKLHNGMIGLKNYIEPVVVEEIVAAPEETNKVLIPQQPVEAPGVLPESLEGYISASIQKVKNEMVEKLNKLPFLVFERIVENLLRDIGFVKYTVVNRRTDGGIDYALNFHEFESNVNMLVVIRRWPQQRKFGVKNAEELLKVMQTHKFNMAVVILFSGYEADVAEYIKTNSSYPIMFLSTDHLAEMLVSRNVGVVKTIMPLYKLDENYIGVIENEISQKIEKHKKTSVSNVQKNPRNNVNNINNTNNTNKTGRQGYYGYKKPHGPKKNIVK